MDPDLIRIDPRTVKEAFKSPGGAKIGCKTSKKYQKSKNSKASKLGSCWDNSIFPMGIAVGFFEGVCVNYRHPDPRRGEPRVGFAPDDAFPLDRVDPVQSSVRLSNTVFYNEFGTFCRNWEPIFGPNP